MGRSTLAIFEARRKLVDDELSVISDEHENIERLIAQLQRRKEILDGRWELVIAERDVLDARIWEHEPRARMVPRPPVIMPSRTAHVPRDLAPEPWDFVEFEGMLAH